MWREKKCAIAVLIGVAVGAGIYGCGSTAPTVSPTPNRTPTSNPAPSIAALSPNSSKQGGPGFTLSVVGSNFVPGATIQWNSVGLQTTVVSPLVVAADVPVSAVSGPGPDTITVSNPAPGGGVSNSLNFAVPCVIATPAPASTQTRARLGAYYFDGWSGPLTHFHFQGMPLGPYQDRQPLTGWQDSSTCAVEQQLALAHNFGINFFIFDWYFNAVANSPGENLNSALQITHSLPDRHGMQFAILFVNGPPFEVRTTDWPSAVNEWLGYMTDSAYVRINGKPAFFIINVGQMRQTFGSSAAVTSALQQLRSAAQARGLPGVYIVGGFGTPDGTMGQETLDDGFFIAQQDGYDAIGFYGYPFAPPPVNGMLPFSTLSQAGHWTWDQARLHSPLPFIPTAMSGWDPRPWNEREPITGALMWYSRTPQDVAIFVSDAISWVEANPTFRVEPAPTPPMVLVEAWNEFGEGSHILPTFGEGTSYGDALAAMLQIPVARRTPSHLSGKELRASRLGGWRTLPAE